MHGYAIRHELLVLVIQNKLLDLYGQYEKPLNLFRDMAETVVEPDVVALHWAPVASSGLSSLMKGRELRDFLTIRNLLMEGSVNSSFVDMSGHYGMIDNSFKIFNMAQHQDLVLWITKINACGLHGQGHVVEGKKFIEIMKCDYGRMPWQEHYACVVDLLGRSGGMNEAYEFLNSMPMEPTTLVWCAVLRGAFQLHSNHELAQVTSRKLLKLKLENHGNYVLISNIFVAMGKWKDIAMVRAR
ncbi:hypothetical protein J5N97_020172 [Dioscorea zingiberensis]|uniref:Pentatricopeptide repeat-containing protein n=1 Tax=Dioscorea zingiberensis TaxID=325984 RepID=A0A9D5HDJ8_9LILI|nr:hypothetical protein J5N97_020172 [Dioscorea zingiberensis]